MTVLTSVTQESPAGRARRGQRWPAPALAHRWRTTSLDGTRTGHAGVAERFEMWSKAFVSKLPDARDLVR